MGKVSSNPNKSFSNQPPSASTKPKCDSDDKKENDKKDDPIKIKIRISVFFDGTGNNKDNTAIRRMYEKNLEIETQLADLEFESLNLDSGAKSSGPYIVTNNKNYSPNEIEYLLQIRKLKDDKRKLEEARQDFIKNEHEKMQQRKNGFEAYAKNRTIWNDRIFKESYMNAYTNVALLWRELKEKDEQYKSHIRIYVEGIGTNTGAGDENDGTAFGDGVTGVKSRAKLAKSAVISSIKSQFNRMRDSFDDTEAVVELDEITLDLFGFSRGAAAARYFCYIAKNDEKMTKRMRDLETHRWEEEIIIFRNIKNSLVDEEKINVNNDLKISFIGLFDTVSSFGKSKMIKRAGADLKADLANKNQHGIDEMNEVDNICELKLNERPNMGETVIHLCAIDEYRYNFALTTIEGFADQSNEYYLPGVHSDVGGSYEDYSDEAKVVRELENTELRQVYANLATAARYDGGLLPYYMESINSAKKNFQNDVVKTIAQWFVDKGWVEKNEVFPNVLEATEMLAFPLIKDKSSMTKDGLYFLSSSNAVFFEVYLKRLHIRNLYSRIPLHFMKDKAIGHDLSFSARIETFEDCGKNAIPTELQFLESEIVKSKSIDYFKDSKLLKVRRNHLHFNISRDSFEKDFRLGAENVIVKELVGQAGKLLIPYAARFKDGVFTRMVFPKK